jgi:acetyl esterase/lipase
MTFSLDTDLMAGMSSARPESTASPAAIERGDWQSLRAFGQSAVMAIEATLPERQEISRQDYFFSSFDGAEVLSRWYQPAGHRPEPAGGAAVVYLHGGGMIMGSVAIYDRLVAAYVADSGIPMLSVDYRLAPEHPHPAPVEDCHAALGWLGVRAAELGVDPSRVAVMGDSGGGGLAAATALLARDREVALARQILVYPMLDDRTTTPDLALLPFAGWTYDNNYTGWQALLGDAIGAADVEPSAAPARATDFTGLAPAYIEVGELDIFRDESIEYARRLAAAGTSVELHVHPGCPHGFDRLSAGADVVRRSRADRLRVLRSL